MSLNENIKNGTTIELLLALLGLDIEYAKAKGDYLYTSDGHKVFDASGSYGINLLGYNHPQLVEELSNHLLKNRPNFLHLADNSYGLRLSQEISQIIQSEGNSDDYEFHFGNTGSEAVDIALRIAYLNWKTHRNHLLSEAYKTLHYIESNKELEDVLKTSFHTHDISSIVTQYKRSLEELKQTPIVAHLSKGYHGKSPGTSSLLEKDIDLPTAYQVSSLQIGEDIEAFLAKHTSFIYLLKGKKQRLVKQPYNNLFAFIFEMVQGEGGIRLINPKWLRSVVERFKQDNVITIADEIQCGSYRCGRLAACHLFNIFPDMYCFGKCLSGGLTKIGVTLYKRRLSNPNFNLWRPNSFSEDRLSLTIAAKALKLLHEKSKNKSYNVLFDKLSRVVSLYPEVFSSVNGLGFMVGITIDKKSILNTFLTKFLNDLNVLGYYISAALLHNESIRVLPSLSAPLTFRIQPSIDVTEKEMDMVCSSFIHLAKAIIEEDETYFAIPIPKITNLRNPKRRLPSQIKNPSIKPGAAVFLCHPIDIAHAKQIIPELGELPDNELQLLMDRIMPLQNFTPYYISSIHKTSGSMIDIVFLGIPLTSKSYVNAIKSSNTQLIIDKIQKAINWANKIEASSIGLGQFNSIITRNGLMVNSPSAVLTTGNNYTTALALRGIEKACIDRDINMQESSVAVFGAGGNIGKTIVEAMAQYIGKVILVYRSLPSNPTSFAEIAKQLQYLIQKKGQIVLSLEKCTSLLVNNTWNDSYGDIVSIQTSKDVLPLDTNIYVLATSSSHHLIDDKYVKPGSIILDVAVPPNASLKTRSRKDISYFMGGLASLPCFNGQVQSLSSHIFPFEPSTAFACMAETIGLAMYDGHVNSNLTGDLQLKGVDEIAAMMDTLGFALAGCKTEQSL